MNRPITVFSDDRRYRYTLWRQWEQDYGELTEYSPTTMRDGFAMFIGLNPSTADETKDDPTIRRCVAFAKSWGYRALCMTNLFAFRATDPKVMLADVSPVGIDNNHYLLTLGGQAEIVVAAWGTHGKHGDRDLDVIELFKNTGIELHHLGLNQNQTPKHPLYLKASTKPEPFYG